MQLPAARGRDALGGEKRGIQDPRVCVPKNGRKQFFFHKNLIFLVEEFVLDPGGGGGLAQGRGIRLFAFGGAKLASRLLTLCGPECVLVVSTEPPDDLSCLTTPGVGCPGGGGGGYQTSRLSLYGHTGVLGSGRSPLVRPSVQATGASLCRPSTSI